MLVEPLWSHPWSQSKMIIFRATGWRTVHQRQTPEIIVLGDHTEIMLAAGRSAVHGAVAASEPGFATVGNLTAQKIAQFVIATHSPMLLTFPGATIFSLEAAAPL